MTKNLNKMMKTWFLNKTKMTTLKISTISEMVVRKKWMSTTEMIRSISDIGIIWRPRKRIIYYLIALCGLSRMLYIP